MPSRFPNRPSHGTVVAYLALFVALSGSAYAVTSLPRNSVGAKQLKANAVRTTKIKNGAVTGTKLAPGVSTQPRGPAGGGLTGAYPNPRLATPEAWHEVGTSGQPAFVNSWTNDFPTSEATAAFYKDPFGMVHLKGLVTGGANDTTIFTLPPGYRPAKDDRWPSQAGDYIWVHSTGEVVYRGSAQPALLAPIEFRAG